MKSFLFVDNIKCNGCVSYIKRKSSTIPGISNINVEIDTGKITFETKGKSTADRLIKLLDQMGYTQRGKSGRIAVAKSFVSCMLGRMNV